MHNNYLMMSDQKTKLWLYLVSRIVTPVLGVYGGVAVSMDCVIDAWLMFTGFNAHIWQIDIRIPITERCARLRLSEQES